MKLQTTETDSPTAEDSPEEIESRVDRYVELEEHIRESYREAEADDSPDTQLDFRLGQVVDSVTSGVETADVIAARRVEGFSSDNVVFETLIDGVEVEFELSYPDDPRDGSNPVVRLCRWAGVSPKHIADLDEVPIVRSESGEPQLLLPPKQASKSAEVIAPWGSHYTFEYGSFRTQMRKLTRAVAGGMLRLGLIGGTRADPRIGLGRGVLLPIAIAIGPIVFMGTTTNFSNLALAIGIMVCAIGLQILMMAADDGHLYDVVPPEK